MGTFEQLGAFKQGVQGSTDQDLSELEFGGHVPLDRLEDVLLPFELRD